jgi:hypothetical protein
LNLEIATKYYLLEDGLFKKSEVIPQNSSTENPVATSTYVNSTYEIRLEYPSDWTIQESNATGTLINIATFVSPTGPNIDPTADIKSAKILLVDRLENRKPQQSYPT